ncbi:hypothetical protein F4859DRAFT_110270 [Xylaria cf. heliscus]|nr:hypothetical protein F4859DRAFT_110270 [Xylaria cf. heliscus]
MDETGTSLDRILGQYQEQLMEGSKQGQRAETTITHLEGVICAIRELEPLGTAEEPDVGTRGDSQKPQVQVQALIYDLQGLEIGPIDKTKGDRLDRPVGHKIHIKCCTIVGVRHGEMSGVVSSNTASANPSYASSRKHRAPSPSAPGYLKRNQNSRRRGRRGREGDNQPPESQNKPQSGLSNARRPFGCPFYFHNKEEHQFCLNYELKRIGDVRQHIYRFHVQPSHCPRCGIVFQDDITYEQRDTHERQRICEATSHFRLYSGATSEQLLSMRNAAAHRGSSTEEERWYAIWEIMFPRIPRPPSPYVDIPCEWSCIEVDAAIVRYQQNGGLQDFIRRRASGFNVQGVLNDLLDHFRNYNHTTFDSAVNTGNARSALSGSYMITEVQSTIPIPSPSPEVRGRSILVSQPTISPGIALPILLPQPPHIDLTHTGRTLPNLGPNHCPNTDVSDELDSFNESYFNNNCFGDVYSRGGDSEDI